MVISSSTGATSSGITSPSQDVVDSELDSWIYLFHWQDILSIENIQLYNESQINEMQNTFTMHAYNI